MIRGRKPKSTRLKVVGGNAGKRKINTEEPSYDVIDIQEPPEELTGIARTIWEEYAPELIASKVLTMVDQHVFYAFCVSYAMWLDAVSQVLPEPDDDNQHIDLVSLTADGGEKKNPRISALTELQRNWERAGSLLGLDPSSRSRLVTPGTKGKHNPFGSRRRTE